MFDDRADAAAALAERLDEWRGHHPLVLAIPCGGVPLGHVIAQRLGGELDVVLVRKLGAPGNPELAVGAVDEGGVVLGRVDSFAGPFGGNGRGHDGVARLDRVDGERVAIGISYVRV